MVLKQELETFNPADRVEYWKNYFGDMDYDRSEGWDKLQTLLYGGLWNNWRDYVGKGWYGFDLMYVPLHWLMVVNDVLSYLYKNNVKFSIQQIKLKYGGIRMYIAFEEQTDKNEEYEEILRQVEELLFDKQLIY